MLNKIMKMMYATLGILLALTLYILFLFVVTATPPYDYFIQNKIEERQATISSDESDFVIESRLQEKFNSAEIDRQVARFNLENNTAKQFFADSGPIYIMTPIRLISGKRSQPGALSPEMQK